mmetsp:Transcript_19139/g.30936  ORF Transcript_19139/g.30936 Transcript_19139/m.30936 type:complete len:338 (+) Transcript_19139:582-1595(+)
MEGARQPRLEDHLGKFQVLLAQRWVFGFGHLGSGFGPTLFGRRGGGRLRERDFVEDPTKGLGAGEDIMGVAGQEGTGSRTIRIGICPNQHLAIKIPSTASPTTAPLRILRLPQSPQTLFQRLLMIRASVHRKSMQNIHALELGTHILLRHLIPQFSQHRIVNVIFARYLIRYANKPLDMLGLHRGIIRTRRLEHYLFQFARRQPLHLAVNVRRERGGLFLRRLGRREHGVLDSGRIWHFVANGGKAAGEGAGRGWTAAAGLVVRDHTTVAGSTASRRRTALASAAARWWGSASSSAATATTGWWRIILIVFVVIVVIESSGGRTASLVLLRRRRTAR